MSHEHAEPSEVTFDHEELRVFWDLARFHAKLNAAPTYFGPTALESVPPPAWTYGADAAESDSFLDGVLAAGAGETRAPLGDYDEQPEPGALSILCDGSGAPAALLSLAGVSRDDDELVERHVVVYARD